MVLRRLSVDSESGVWLLGCFLGRLFGRRVLPRCRWRHEPHWVADVGRQLLVGEPSGGRSAGNPFAFGQPLDRLFLGLELLGRQIRFFVGRFWGMAITW
jgi:hypothetical protein